MQEQNFKNHLQLVPVWHFITSLLVVTVLVASIINFAHFNPHTHFLDAIVLGIGLVIGIFYWFIRSFALKAQDRAIRAEENLRYFILTGKPLDKHLRLGQVIALRFASDEEFVALAKKAVDEQLTPKQIKQAVQNWRGDYHRV